MPVEVCENVATDEVLFQVRPLARDIPDDERAHFRTRQVVQEVGELALSREVEYSPDNRECGSIGYENLMEAMWFAGRGEEKARKMVEANARTHILECLLKAGIIFEIDINVDSRGRLIQHGQLLEEVYRNALLWAADGPEMRERTLLETYNGFLAESWFKYGLLEGESIIVISPYPTSPDMTDERARKIGFFPETKSCAIQSIELRNGGLVQKVAFVAGAKETGGKRHDLPAIDGLAAELGIMIDTTSSASVLGTPFAVSSEVSLLDIVRCYDRHAGGTFFGQNVEPEDYEAYAARCRERMANFEPIVQDVVAEVVAQAETLYHPMDAVRLLHDVAQRHMVAAAAEDRSIDARVFGPQAVQHIQAARQAFKANDWIEYNRALSRAHATAITGSCPISERSRNGSDGNDATANGLDSGSERAGNDIPSIIRCIRCRKFSSRSEVVHKDFWCCPKCTYKVDVCTGKVLHESNAVQPEQAEQHEPIRFPLMRTLLAAA